MGYYGAMRDREGASQDTIKIMLTRHFVLVFLALFTFLTANYSLIPTLPIYFSRSGSAEMEIGVLVGIFGASSVVFRLVVGSALLKYSEKIVMMFGALLFAFTFLASIVLRPFWPFFAVRFFQGIAFACIDTAALALIIKATPSANRGRALGYFVLAPVFSQAIAPSLGMFLVDKYGFAVLFLICTGLSLCAFSFSWNLKRQETVRPDKETSAHDSLFLERRIVVPGILSFLQQFVWGGLMAFFSLYAIKCGVTNPGFFFSAVAVMLMAGRIMGGRVFDAYSEEKIILVCILTSIAAMVILSFQKPFPCLFLWDCFGEREVHFSFLHQWHMLSIMPFFGRHCRRDVPGALGSGLALGPMIVGIIIPLTGYRAMFLCLAFVCLINLAYFQPM